MTVGAARPTLSWGRYPRVVQREIDLSWRTQPLPAAEQSMLAYGMGRSYGDSCLNEGGAVLRTRGLNRFISFDPGRGILRCEAGVTITEVLDLIVPRGWFVPVSPGTRHVTVGGAIANDVHGKNHHRLGAFGCHLRALELVRSDGERAILTRSSSPGLFEATIGGLGLTGLITWAEFSLIPVGSALIREEVTRFGDLAEFESLSEEARNTHDYTVGWVDALAGGRKLGRGVFFRGNHAEATAGREGRRRAAIPLPFDCPDRLLNRLTIRAVNTAYYWRPTGGGRPHLVHYDRFFYPLDAIDGWNRLYGRRGLLQHQFVVPRADGIRIVREVLELVRDRGAGSFLAVLKVFGELTSPGLLSFPRPGITLALDLAFRGRETLELCDRLDRLVISAGGAVYPAKDARMSPATFRASFPRLDEFRAHVDPGFSSSLWRRVEGGRS